MRANGEGRCWTGLAELRPLLELHLVRHCRDASEIDDVVQETLLRAARYRAGLADAERLRPWVLQISLNVLRDRIRRETRLPREECDEGLLAEVEARDEHDVGAVEERPVLVLGIRVERERALAGLARALASLRAEDRELLTAYYAGRRSCDDTGRACLLPATVVKTRLFRARRRLLRLLAERFAPREPLPPSLVRRSRRRRPAACAGTAPPGAASRAPDRHHADGASAVHPVERAPCAVAGSVPDACGALRAAGGRR